jgi:hyaluronan synthase
VSCISGPLGLYRKTVVDQIKEEWLEQTFLGTKCTFGDDRHLTNLVLNYGYSTYYTPESVCVTDTPAELLRWIAQQTRWCKSFYREFLINIKSFYKHPPWLAGQLVFQTFFPFFIIATLIWFVTVSIDIYCIIVIMMILMGVIRSFFAIIRTGKLVFLYYSFYVVLYVLFLIPSKMWALITVWNNDWGTSARMARISGVIKAIHALVWAAFFIAYYVAIGIKHFYYGNVDFKQVPTLYVFIGSIVFMIVLYMHWLVYSECFLLPAC